VIFNKEMVHGRERVTTDEHRILRGAILARRQTKRRHVTELSCTMAQQQKHAKTVTRSHKRHQKMLKYICQGNLATDVCTNSMDYVQQVL